MSPDITIARDLVESAFARFATGKRLAEANEATTRHELIDKILDALGWSQEQTSLEQPSGSGDYLDYELRLDGDPWLVVEAKRVGESFIIDQSIVAAPTTHIRSISTLLSNGGENLRKALKQAAKYCNDRAVPYACVTNGYQWAFFRGLSTEKHPWNKGRALVFASCEALLGRFNDFFSCLARLPAAAATLPRLLEHASTSELPTPITPYNFLTLRRHQVDGHRVASLRSVCDYLLTDIHRDDRRSMLEECYVSPGTESDFDHTIAKLLKDTSVSLSKEEENVLEGDTTHFVHEIEARERINKMRHPVIVAGHVGAGKTTFLHKSLAHFRSARTAFCAFLDQEGLGHAGAIDWRSEENDLAQRITEKLSTGATTTLHAEKFSEGAIRQADPHDHETLYTLLRQELGQQKRLGQKLWDKDPTAWERKKYELMVAYRDRPVQLLVHYIRHLRARFQRKDKSGLRFPILIVIDNVDQATNEYQKCVYGLAQRLTSQTPAVVILSLREDTFRSGRRPDGFLSSSPLQFIYHVAAPALDHVLRLRARFATHAVEKELLPARMLALRSDVLAVCDLIKSMVSPGSLEMAELVAGLSGNDVRNALSLVRESMLGSALLGKTGAGTSEHVLEALLASLGPEFVRSRLGLGNCFDAHPSIPPCHALALRLLAYYAWTMEDSLEQPLAEMTERVIVRFAAWGYQPAQIETALRSLVSAGLIRGAVDHHEDSTSHGQLPLRLSITAAGHIHLERLAYLKSYRAMMACLSRWYDRELAEKFIKDSQAAGGRMGATLGDIALSPALQVFEAYLRLAVAREDHSLAASLVKQSWLKEVLSRSNSIFGQPQHRSDHPIAGGDELGSMTSSGDQLPLFRETEERASSIKVLRRISRDLRCRGSVWIPRILWALEWGKRNDTAALTAADIARILRSHGDVDVEGPNVARAFRDCDPEAVADLWQSTRRRYEITAAGSALIAAIIEEQINA